MKEIKYIENLKCPNCTTGKQSELKGPIDFWQNSNTLIWVTVIGARVDKLIEIVNLPEN